MGVVVGPVLFGYQCVRAQAPRDALSRGHRALVAFAEREGFALGTVFVERSLTPPLAALASLIEAARRQDVTAVAVPTPTDLGLSPGVRVLTRRRLEREAGLRVLIAGPVPR